MQRKSLCVHPTLLRIFPILTLFFNIWKVKLASFFFRSEYLSFLSILCQIFSCYYTVFWSSFFSNPQNEYFIHFDKLFSFTKLLHFSDHQLVRCFLCFWYQFVFSIYMSKTAISMVKEINLKRLLIMKKQKSIFKFKFRFKIKKYYKFKLQKVLKLKLPFFFFYFF